MIDPVLSSEVLSIRRTHEGFEVWAMIHNPDEKKRIRIIVQKEKGSWKARPGLFFTLLDKASENYVLRMLKKRRMEPCLTKRGAYVDWEATIKALKNHEDPPAYIDDVRRLYFPVIKSQGKFGESFKNTRWVISALAGAVAAHIDEQFPVPEKATSCFECAHYMYYGRGKGESKGDDDDALDEFERIEYDAVTQTPSFLTRGRDRAVGIPPASEPSGPLPIHYCLASGQWIELIEHGQRSISEVRRITSGQARRAVDLQAARQARGCDHFQDPAGVSDDSLLWVNACTYVERGRAIRSRIKAFEATLNPSAVDIK